MSTFYTRLEKTLEEHRRYRSLSHPVSVNSRDLEDLLHHFNRLDMEARIRYEQEQAQEHGYIANTGR